MLFFLLSQFPLNFSRWVVHKWCAYRFITLCKCVIGNDRYFSSHSPNSLSISAGELCSNDVHTGFLHHASVQLEITNAFFPTLPILSQLQEVSCAQMMHVQWFCIYIIQMEMTYAFLPTLPIPSQFQPVSWIQMMYIQVFYIMQLEITNAFLPTLPIPSQLQLVSCAQMMYIRTGFFHHASV